MMQYGTFIKGMFVKSHVSAGRFLKWVNVGGRTQAENLFFSFVFMRLQGHGGGFYAELIMIGFDTSEVLQQSRLSDM